MLYWQKFIKWQFFVLAKVEGEGLSQVSRRQFGNMYQKP